MRDHKNDASALSARFVLVMIVKNEATIVPRMLASVKRALGPWFQGAVICDTGSTDETLACFHRELVDSKVLLPSRCILFSEPWRNFGFNRTCALHRAHDAIQEWSQDTSVAVCADSKHGRWDPQLTYLVTLDADMELTTVGAGGVGGSVPTPQQLAEAVLPFDELMLEQGDGGLKYWNSRLLRSSIRWESRGVTHEYNSPPAHAPPTRSSRCTLWSIADRNDGGNRSTKFERDLQLLQQAVRDQPNDARSWFYYGNTLRDLKQYPEAVHAYTQHQKLGSFDEEVWQSKYYTAMCYECMGQRAEALSGYLACYVSRPQRAEPLCRLARWFRQSPQLEAAAGFPFALAASRLPVPASESLFVETDLYRSVISDLSICATWAGCRAEGRRALLRLLHQPHLFHSWEVAQARCNLQFLVPEWSATYPRRHALAVPVPQSQSALGVQNWSQWPELLAVCPQGYHACNPSLALRTPTSCEALAVIRLVNYTQRRANHYQIHDSDGVVRTLNVIVTLDKSGTGPETQWQCRSVELLDQLPAGHGPFRAGTRVAGLEDVRLFVWQDQYWFLATSAETTLTHTPGLVLGRLAERTFSQPQPADAAGLSAWQVAQVWALQGPTAGRVEKNWLPWPVNQVPQVPGGRPRRGGSKAGPVLRLIYHYQGSQLQVLEVTVSQLQDAPLLLDGGQSQWRVVTPRTVRAPEAMLPLPFSRRHQVERLQNASVGVSHAVTAPFVFRQGSQWIVPELGNAAAGSAHQLHVLPAAAVDVAVHQTPDNTCSLTDSWRGSAGPVGPLLAFRLGPDRHLIVQWLYLLLVHECAAEQDGATQAMHRTYYHRFAAVDAATGKITHCTDPFVFGAPFVHVEVATGLALTGDHDQAVVVTFGREDATAHSVTVSVPDILSRLHALDDLTHNRMQQHTEQ